MAVRGSAPYNGWRTVTLRHPESPAKMPAKGACGPEIQGRCRAIFLENAQGKAKAAEAATKFERRCRFTSEHLAARGGW